MQNPKFYIQPRRYTGESSVISMRLPKDMLKEIDNLATSTGRTRNEVLSLCLEFALTHLENGIDNTEKI